MIGIAKIQPVLPESKLTRLKMPSKCPTCGKPIRVRVPAALLENATHYPVCHLVLHGKPLHACMVYIDAHGMVRASESTTSIQLE